MGLTIREHTADAVTLLVERDGREWTVEVRATMADDGGLDVMICRDGVFRAGAEQGWREPRTYGLFDPDRPAILMECGHRHPPSAGARVWRWLRRILGLRRHP